MKAKACPNVLSGLVAFAAQEVKKLGQAKKARGSADSGPRYLSSAWTADCA